ncbi:hypothetical protein RCJ22_26760 [Vibrio sp. FNV 38]|nr:hypothetical protein [Vibrio sp. FNV 38]
MICRYNRLVLLVGLFAWPAVVNAEAINTNQTNSISAWTFSGTGYKVSQSEDLTYVAVKRTHSLPLTQLKAVCRKGLGLGLRHNYETQLIDMSLIEQRYSDWPLAGLSYAIERFEFKTISSKQITCSARVIDNQPEDNLDSTALSYALAFYSTDQFDKIPPLLSHLMKKPSVSMDAASLVSLLLSQNDQQKAMAYFERYVDSTTIQRDELRLMTAQWQFNQGKLAISQTLLRDCPSADCHQLNLQIEDALSQKEQDSAGDLSTYFH